MLKDAELFRFEQFNPNGILTPQQTEQTWQLIHSFKSNLSLSSQSYEIYLDGQLVLKKEKEIFEVRPTKKQLNLIQLAIDQPHKVLNQVQIKHHQQILYWVKNRQLLKNLLINQELKT